MNFNRNLYGIIKHSLEMMLLRTIPDSWQESRPRNIYIEIANEEEF